MKIRNKLIVSFVFLITLTALLYGLAVYSSISKPLRNYENKTSLHYAELIAYQIDHVLEHLRSDISVLSRQDFLRTIQDPTTPLAHESPDRFRIFRKELLQNVALVTDGHTDPLSIHDLEARFLEPARKDLELRIIPREGPDASLLRVSKTFLRPDGTQQGEGFVFLDMKTLFNELILKDNLNRTCVCIRDASGRLLYSSEIEPMDEGSIDLLLPYSREAKENLETEMNNPFQTTPIHDEKGELFLIAAWIPALGLPGFIEPDFLGLESLVSSTSMNLIMIGVAIVWITVWTAMILGYRIMKPIEDLTLGAGRIASGEYDYRLETQGEDEIGLMAGKFNEMAEAVGKRSRELEKSNLALKEQDLQKTRFLDIVAHDLRTPLTSIKAYTDLLLRFPDEDPRTKQEFLQIVLKESDRMASLINDYLDLTKLENGTLPYRLQEVDLGEMIREFEQINQGECAMKQIHIRSEVKGPLPPIQADPDRLSQVFSNLLSNAIRYSPPGGEITIEAVLMKKCNGESDKDCIEVTVSDQGPGIPKEFHDKIFDKFRQLNTQFFHPKGGTGLGLPISKEIISRHNGSIWAADVNGRGSVFKFRVPVIS